MIRVQQYCSTLINELMYSGRCFHLDSILQRGYKAVSPGVLVTIITELLFLHGAGRYLVRSEQVRGSRGPLPGDSSGPTRRTARGGGVGWFLTQRNKIKEE